MLDKSKHRSILLQILKDIYSDIEISSALGFKGGTAAYLFYELGRFSVDLDFDLLDESKSDIIFERLAKSLKDYGEIQDSFPKRFTIFFLISYGKKEHNIKIEINKRSFGSKYEIKNYLGISIQTMVIEDMFAHKLVALLDRKNVANRDIFDIWFFLKNHYEINEKIIKTRTELKLKEYLDKCVKFLEKYNDKYLLQGIGELIDEKQKVWIKNKLKSEVLFLLKVKLQAL